MRNPIVRLWILVTLGPFASMADGVPTRPVPIDAWIDQLADAAKEREARHRRVWFFQGPK